MARGLAFKARGLIFKARGLAFKARGLAFKARGLAFKARQLAFKSRGGHPLSKKDMLRIKESQVTKDTWGVLPLFKFRCIALTAI